MGACEPGDLDVPDFEVPVVCRPGDRFGWWEERQLDDNAFAAIEADEACRSMAIVAFLVLTIGGAAVGLACWAWWRWA